MIDLWLEGKEKDTLCRLRASLISLPSIIRSLSQDEKNDGALDEEKKLWSHTVTQFAQQQEKCQSNTSDASNHCPQQQTAHYASPNPFPATQITERGNERKGKGKTKRKLQDRIAVTEVKQIR